MKSRELEIIQELMEELKDEMQYGEEDFSERLGKGKPKVEVMEIEAKMPMKGEGMMAKMLGDKMEEGEEPEMEMEEDEEMDEFDPEMGSFISKDDPEDALKKRLLKLRK